MSIYEQVPFPDAQQLPTSLALKLQKRIEYMFGIVVEPIIIRYPGSYYKTRAFRYLWSMQTPCGRYEIACYEKAAAMANKSAWHVLDQVSLLKYQGLGLTTGKVIY